MEKINLEAMRHSCAHLLAAAVMELWPKTKRTIGPAIDNGFYFDFEFETPISEKDLPTIEKKMHEIVKSWNSFERFELSENEAKKEYPGNEYKHELIEEIAKKSKVFSFYKSGNYWDLCEGGHIDNPGNKLKHFKLLSIAGAYWRGSEKNKMLTRIYGTCFETKEELDKYLWQQEEVKKRDHRILGKKLDLFVFSDLVGKGLPLFTEKGSVIRRQLEQFIVNEEIKRGYYHVYTPDLARVELYKTSGHYPYYKDTMYPVMKIDDDEFILRPMTCPHHFQLYASKPRTYKELPIRFAELAKQFRYEKSGELTGLIRIRSFCLADAHIIARKDQATDEINKALDLIEYSATILGLNKGEDYRYQLSLGDRSDNKKYYKDDNSWNFAEQVLRNVLKDRKAPFFEAPGEAAFYGPKIDIQMKNFSGKEETAFTVQYDFVMPKRFHLEYIDSEGKKQEPIVIHRSSIGAIERVMALLIEKYAGAFPLWLSPVQVAILPVSDKFLDYTQSLYDELIKRGIRAEINKDNKTLGAKIRESTLQKIPYMGIIGEREKKDKKISIRTRDGKDLGEMDIYKFLEILTEKIENHTS
jgi:threonyl-tRNA synthetase